MSWGAMTLCYIVFSHRSGYPQFTLVEDIRSFWALRNETQEHYSHHPHSSGVILCITYLRRNSLPTVFIPCLAGTTRIIKSLIFFDFDGSNSVRFLWDDMLI